MFVVSNDVDSKIAKRFVDQNFVLKLLVLFGSEDPRERGYLMTFLHHISGNLMALLSFVRRAIQHVFSRVIYEGFVVSNDVDPRIAKRSVAGTSC